MGLLASRLTCLCSSSPGIANRNNIFPWCLPKVLTARWDNIQESTLTNKHGRNAQFSKFIFFFLKFSKCIEQKRIICKRCVRYWRYRPSGYISALYTNYLHIIQQLVFLENWPWPSVSWNFCDCAPATNSEFSSSIPGSINTSLALRILKHPGKTFTIVPRWNRNGISLCSTVFIFRWVRSQENLTFDSLNQWASTFGAAQHQLWTFFRPQQDQASSPEVPNQEVGLGW